MLLPLLRLSADIFDISLNHMLSRCLNYIVKPISNALSGILFFCIRNIIQCIRKKVDYTKRVKVTDYHLIYIRLQSVNFMRENSLRKVQLTKESVDQRRKVCFPPRNILHGVWTNFPTCKFQSNTCSFVSWKIQTFGNTRNVILYIDIICYFACSIPV